MKTRMKQMTALLNVLFLLAPAAHATTYYVATNGNDSADGLSWATARQTIQAAIDLTVSNDTVLVSNGVYATGGRLAGSITNRIAITNAISVKSSNGASATSILGLGPIGNAAIRCAYVGDGAMLSGFTISNGYTKSFVGAQGYGGGVYCATANGVVSNCIISGNFAYGGGGGCKGGTIYNCTLIGNNGGSVLGGGGASSGVLYNCLITGNTAYGGGGAYQSTLFNCTVAANYSYGGSGGTWDSSLFNSIIYYNMVTNYSGGSSSNCCTTPMPPSGAANFTNAPMMWSTNNLHLMPGSPCIDAGNSSYPNSGIDIDGDPRTNGTAVDVGCDEFNPSNALSVSIAVVPGTNSQIGASLYYQALVVGNPLSIAWQFSDGAGMTNQAEVYRTFTTGGIYSVIVTVTNMAVTASATTSVQVAPFPLLWVSTNSTAWDYVTPNWLDLISLQGGAIFSTGAVVRFDDSTQNVQTNVVIGPGMVFPGDIKVDASANSYSITGTMTGSGGLFKSGRSVLTLKSTNTFRGGITVSSGSLVCASGRANGLYTGSVIRVEAGALLDFGGQSQAIAGLSGGGTVTSAMFALTLTVPTSTTNEFAGPLVGGFQFTKVGVTNGSGGIGLGTLILSGTNTFMGDMTVNAGTVMIRNSTALGVGTKNVLVRNGSAGHSQLALDGTTGDINLATNLTFWTSWVDGTILNIVGNNSISGPVLMMSGGGDTAIIVAGGSLTLGGTMTFTANGRNLVLAGAGTGTVSGAIQASVTGPNMGVTKNDVGTWTLSGGNTYPGQTTVSGGTLVVATPNALSTNCPVYFVSSGAVLDASSLPSFSLVPNQALTGGGMLHGSVGGSGSIQPGDFGTGTLSVSGDYSPTSNQTLTIRVNGVTNFTCLSVGGNAALSGKISVTSTNISQMASGSTFVVLQAPAILGTFTATNVPQLSPYLAWQVAYSSSNVTLSVQPSAYGLWSSAITNGLTNLTDCATGDGYPNLLKYATGSSPTNSDNLAKLSGTPTTNGFFALNFNRNTNANDITLIAEGNYDLTNSAAWNGIATNIAGSWGGASNVTESGSSTPVAVTIQDPAPPATNRFLRLRVTRP